MRLRACNFKYIAIQWEKPASYGDALITGYKVFVNGVVEAVLGADQFTYSFTHGKWCREYVFQVQVGSVIKIRQYVKHRHMSSSADVDSCSQLLHSDSKDRF